VCEYAHLFTFASGAGVGPAPVLPVCVQARKQGDPLSTTLFSTVIDDIIKQLELRGNISTRLKQFSAYADDILITARTKQTLTDTFEKLKNFSSQFGLIVNVNKTKYMKCTRKVTKPDRLKVGNMQVDQVRSFSYLGTVQ
jgi:hypothetical protein